MTVPQPVVRAEQLSARFPGGGGVGPLDLEVAAGESILVLGPSGCGKSTLLRLLQGAIPRVLPAATTGIARVAGRDAMTSPAAGLADVLGVVAQDPATGVCLPDVEDEIAFPLENLGVDPAVIGGRVDGALARTGALGLRGRDTSSLSGGEAQRIALAAATVAHPQVLLLDEPTAMLDADGMQAVRSALDELRHTTDAACILVEHRLDEFGDTDSDAAGTGLPARWLVLGQDGAPLFDGDPDDLDAALARRLVAEGCWLPLEIELLALTGIRGGLGDDRILARVREVAVRKATAHAVSAASAVLTARGLAVAPASSPRTVPVLRDVDVTLRTGEIVALVGANGGGKSTLLHALAGVASPHAGAVAGPRPGLVFQNPEHQFSAHTVRDEIGYGLGADAAGRIDEMLDRFDLHALADRNPYTLSGGQKRRLSLAAMLVHDRPFLLADEPGFGLDRRSALIAMRALRDAARDGRGVLFSSHDLRAVATYADRVVVIADGGVAAVTTPVRMLRDPQLLRKARLHPPRLLRELVARGLDDDELRAVLVGLDDIAQAARTEAVMS